MKVPSNIVSAAVSDRGLSEHRPQNEDSFLDLPGYGLFAVADGVGGAQGGDVASQTAMEILGEAFANASGSQSVDQVIRSAIETANSAIYQMATDLPQLSSMATTVAVLHISGDSATIAHVGDSRVYRIDPEGFIHRETHDHSVVEEEVRAGRMTPEQAIVHPSRNVISRAVGAESTVQIDLKTITIEPGTLFLLCSDGVTRHINDNELGELLSTGMSPALLCEQIKDVCYERGAEDNLTAVIVNTPAEIEEVTIASARSPFDRTIKESEIAETESQASGLTAAERFGFPAPEDGLQTEASQSEPESPSQVEAEEEAEAQIDNESYLMEDESEAPEASAGKAGDEYTSSRVIVPAKEHDSAKEFSIFGSQANVYAKPEVPPASSVRRAVSSLLLLILGGVLGFGGYYFYLQAIQIPPTQPVEPPPLTEMTSSNIPLTSFEESRREVDKDPASYLAKRAATPQDAEDHYLLGRALLLSGKYFEAKRQFALAIEKLDQSEPENKGTLIVEIAMANALIENGPASESFKKELSARTPAQSASNTAKDANAVNIANQTNAAGSTASNTNRPIR